jgi:hypothetical protein
MDKEKKMERMLPRVKQTVDAVYEYLTPHPDGCGMAAKDFGKTNSRIVTSLVTRKIIEKTNLGRGEYKYKWAATMAPTSTLYRSIALEIQTESQRYQEEYQRKKSSPKVEDCPSPVAVVNELLEEKPVEKSPLEEIQEMWERMKQLGATIENNQLVCKIVLS